MSSSANAAFPTLGQPKLITCTLLSGNLSARRMPHSTLKAPPSEWPVTQSVVSGDFLSIFCTWGVAGGGRSL